MQTFKPKSRAKILFILCTILCTFTYTLYGQRDSAVNYSNNSKQIFILASYHSTQQWNYDIIKGILEHLNTSGYNIFIEYLDAKRYNLTKERTELYIENFNKSYANNEFDMIVAIDNPALSFLNTQIEHLPFLQNTPIIAGGINNYDRQMISNIPYAIVYPETQNDIATFSALPELFPNYKNLYIIADYTLTGNEIRKGMTKDYALVCNSTPDFNAPQLLFNQSTKLSDIIKEIKALPEKSVVCISSYTYDGEQYIAPEQLLDALKGINRPLIVMQDFYVNEQTLGGCVLYGEGEGELLGSSVANYFNGTLDTTNVAPRMKWVLSYPALKKWGLLKVPLPSETELLYVPTTFFERHPYLPYIILLAFLISIGVIVITINFNAILKQRVDKALKSQVEINAELEKMVEKMKLMMLNQDRFIANSMHDLKNFIAPITSYAEMLTMEGLSEEKKEELTKKIYKSTLTMSDTFIKMMNVSKAKGEMISATPSQFSIYNLVNETIGMNEENYIAKGVTIENRLQKEQIVFADFNMIYSVMLNLIGNAVKFTPQNGNVIIEGQNIDANTFEIRVKDSGVGIDLEKFDLMKNESRYFSTKGTDGEEGSGLGLLLCNELITNNKGTFRAALNPEGGTSMIFTLPTC
ncbi:MAG: HAMP domain-containing histidine kinase [Bacteroidales bacterium]|nr:HAMP domain-containing histidine kinase [Bacteroidales bacterium]